MRRIAINKNGITNAQLPNGKALKAEITTEATHVWGETFKPTTPFIPGICD